MTQDIDKSYLNTRTFTAFSETSKHQYVYLCNVKTNVTRWSKGAVEYFGLPDEYIYDTASVWGEHVHPDDKQAYFDDLEAVFSGKKERHDVDYRALNKDGEYVMCTCRGIMLKGENGEPDLFAGTLINHGISDNIDPITGLYNIYDFLKATRSLLDSKKRTGVLLVGFNRFSEVNDIYSYEIGNSILKEFACKVKDVIGDNTRLFRMDGAKFAIILNDADRTKALALYSKIQDIAKNDITIGENNVSLSISGGAVAIDDYSGCEHSVLASLTFTLEKSKEEKHSELVFFENGVNTDGKKKIELMNAIRQSVVKGCSGFYLCYQPLVREGDNKTIGMEALLRWRQDLYGEVSPGIFIPWLENDTCFFELGNWILEQALTDGKKIVEEYPEFVINVNVSYAQLERSGFRDAVMDILEKTGFPPKNLCIELTERCRNLNTEFLRNELNFFRSKGIQIALDDFGTGASSLNLLRELPIDCLKIDQTFIAHIQANNTDQTIVESVIQCANKLGIKVCIEGIKTKQISDFVEKYKADTHQGYFYSRPVRIEKFVEML